MLELVSQGGITYKDMIKYPIAQSVFTEISKNKPLHKMVQIWMNENPHLLGLGCTPDTINFFIKVGLDINAQDEDGNTLLHKVALCHKNLDIATFLLLPNHGLRINIKNNYGNTPLHTACISNNAKMVTLLLDNGADITIENKDHDTAEEVTSSNFIKKLVDLARKDKAHELDAAIWF